MKRIIALFFAVLVLSLSLKIGVALHFCGGKLAQFKIVLGYGKASCGMEKNKNSCENRFSASIHDRSCCQNHFFQIASDDYQPSDFFSQFQVEFIPTVTPLYIETFGSNVEFDNYTVYRPPPDLSSVSLPFIRIFRI